MDIILDKDGDIRIENSDLIIGDTFNQEVNLILNSSKGEWKNEPLVGANLKELLKTKQNNDKAAQYIRIALEQDKKRLKNISFEENQFFIDVE